MFHTPNRNLPDNNASTIPAPQTPQPHSSLQQNAYRLTSSSGNENQAQQQLQFPPSIMQQSIQDIRQNLDNSREIINYHPFGLKIHIYGLPKLNWYFPLLV
ncbi:hypothetical protein CVS40_12802 [Lucilia cuprina]|nr:hypothetical protein CVS40_12802 [Lucilia cuprina]